MSDDRRRAMYDGFDSVTHGHSDAWVRVADEFLALACNSPNFAVNFFLFFTRQNSGVTFSFSFSLR
jgi:hypothetical protein